MPPPETSAAPPHYTLGAYPGAYPASIRAPSALDLAPKPKSWIKLSSSIFVAAYYISTFLL